MGAIASKQQKYNFAQANFLSATEELARLEFHIEGDHHELGTPLPHNFPTPCTYWGRANGIRIANGTRPHTVLSNPLLNGQNKPPPILLNISEELEERLICPITLEVMFDPWIDNEGNSYEYAAIIDHLTRSQTSPITRKPMFPTESYLRPNRMLREIIQLYTDTPPPFPSTPTKN
jgi:hypothetical protein